MKNFILIIILLMLIGSFVNSNPNNYNKDLVAIDASLSPLLKDANLTYIWRSSDYFLAIWDKPKQNIARFYNIKFDIIIPNINLDKSYYIIDLMGNQLLPQGILPLKKFENNHEFLIQAEPEYVEKLIAKGYHVILLPVKEEKYIQENQLIPFTCTYNPLIESLLNKTSQNQWLDWIKKMTGVDQIYINGTPYTVKTRYSTSLFDGSTNAKGYDFLLQQSMFWHYDSNIEEDEYTHSGKTWKNLILTIPGQTNPNDIVILSAHFDSISSQPTTSAPGADDNMSGSATLLEAARLFRQFKFQRTIKIIFFTGEEQGLIGSNAYVNDHPTSNILGVLNMDMFGYDGDNDRCFEIHAGTMPSSQDVGYCFGDSINAYNLNLSYDFITNGATSASDHASFWNKGVGAIEILENGYNNSLPNGCIGTDFNPYYHSINDTIPNMTVSYSYDIGKAGLASIAAMAIPIESCFNEAPILTATPQLQQVDLNWTSITGANSYRIYRSTQSCYGQWTELIETTNTFYSDTNIIPETTYYYYVEAVASDGFCVSNMSNCEIVSPPTCESCAKYVPNSAIIEEINGGDSDNYPDNCETVISKVTIQNIGSGTAINTIVNITTNEPFITITTPMPINIGNIPYNSTKTADFSFTVGQGQAKANCMQKGLFTISVQAEGQTQAAEDSFSFDFEIDQYSGDLLWQFEPLTGLEGWTIESGTWSLSTARYNPGTSTASIHSSQYANNQCDVITSPIIKPSNNSLLTIPNWYLIESQSSYWYDRANIHIINIDTNTRTLLIPNNGKLYQSGQFYNWGTSCEIYNEQGWAGINGNFWGNSYFDLSNFADKLVKIEIRYMTDPAVNDEGIYVDDISVTNVDYFGCDTQNDDCLPTPYLIPYQYKKPIIDDSSSPKANGIIDQDESVYLISTLENIGTAPATQVIGNITTNDNINIEQSNSSFPDINENEHQSCISCYKINAPSNNRPSVHWDITITENVAADGFGPLPYNYIYHIGESFKDVPIQIEYMIETIFHNGITAGCTPDNFCPYNYVPRQQMAKFICLAMEKYAENSCPINICTNMFQDVPASNPFCSFIEAIKNIGITDGCQSNPPLFCPSSYITRQAMAKFICLAMEETNPGSCPLSQCSNIFTDVNSSNPFCPYIESLYYSGIISGCSSSPLNYCPSDYVKRLQMAKFITLAFNLEL